MVTPETAVGAVNAMLALALPAVAITLVGVPGVVPAATGTTVTDEDAADVAV
jgi:hypothetical protein